MIKKILDSQAVWLFIGIIFPIAVWFHIIKQIVDPWYYITDVECIVVYCIVTLAMIIICIKHFIFKDLF